MTIDRRTFFAGAGLGLGVGAASFLAASPAALAAAGVPSLADYGVRPDPLKDQGEALQRALDQAGWMQQPLFMPPGIYRTERTLTIPQNVSLFGAPGSTVLSGGSTTLLTAPPGNVWLEGLTFAPALKPFNENDMASFRNCDVTIRQCAFLAGGGLRLEKCKAIIEGCIFNSSPLGGVSASGSLGVTVVNCSFVGIAQTAIAVATAPGEQAAQILNNRVVNCRGAGIYVSGGAVVSGNVASGCGVGLRLGGEKSGGGIMASQNHVSGCAIGIACAGEGDYIFATLNMISGAKDGAIRALIDGKPVGPDLAKASAEAYRNLAIAGNVAL